MPRKPSRLVRKAACSVRRPAAEHSAWLGLPVRLRDLTEVGRCNVSPSAQEPRLPGSRIGPSLVAFGPELVDFGSLLVGFGLELIKFEKTSVKHRPILVNRRPDLLEIGPDLVELGQSVVQIGPKPF